MTRAAITRWTVSRKADVCLRIARGELAMTDAMAEYDLSFAELQGWLEAHTLHGEAGLRAGRCGAMRHISGPLARALADTPFAPPHDGAPETGWPVCRSSGGAEPQEGAK